MGEVQEQRYVCKICSKSCVSGKSLGGHMRVHLALISASKKAVKERAEIKLNADSDDDDESNSGFLSEEKIRVCDSSIDFGDGDQNNSYELRENPKQSWRISDLKRSVSMNANCCKECGKEFPSLRALSGHMRCHSIKNKKVKCQQCGKGFDSMRALFGHMKSHSKKSRVTNESAESLSDLENLCPVRRKRSKIGYKTASNPSFSSINASNSAVSELGEAEEAATCLIMLSRGVKDCLKFESFAESSDDDSVYFGAESSRRSKKFPGYDGGFLSDVEKKTKMSLPAGKLDYYYSSGYANAFTEKNVSEFDDLDYKFVDKDQKKVDSEVADDENKMKVDFVSDDRRPSVHKFLKTEQCNESALSDEDFLVATGKNEDSSNFFESNYVKKEISFADESGSEKNISENEANLETLKDFKKRPEYRRRICKKIFHSHCSLGDQNDRHKMEGSISTVNLNTSVLSVTEDDSKLDQLEFGDNQLEQESRSVGISLESSKSKEYECPTCFKVFASGQALGGHKRAHYNGFTESKNQEAAEVRGTLDLNFPVTVDEGTKNDVGLNMWWADRSCEHELLVLTN